MAGDAGLILACAGCCCGHPAHGGALSPQRTLKSTLRRLYKKATGLDGRVRLAFTDCLGPCSEANVIFLYLLGQPLWFRRMNAPELVGALLDHCRTAESGSPLPEELATRSFSWTGGGIGPAPPVDVITPG